MNKTTRILLVDDEPEILRTIVPFLESVGHSVWTASTGREALQSTREKHPDLVLLDVLLPDFNGIEVCKQIKADPKLRDVSVVLISGGATGTAHKVEGLEASADDYMVKPFEPDELLARIRTTMRLRDSMAALRASEEYHRRLVNILPDAVCLMQPDGRLLAVNAQAVKILAYANSEELLQKNAFELAPREEHERIKADIATVLQTGMIRNAGYTLLKKDGVPFQVEASATVSLGNAGQPAGLLFVGRDVTERNDAEQKIRQLLALLDRASDAIVVRDPEGRVEYFNQGAEHLLGWTADEVRGQRVQDLFFKDKSDFTRVQQQLLQTGEWSGEIEAITKAGKQFVVYSRWTLVRNTDQPPRVVSISTDITARKRAEEAFQHNHERYRRLAESSPDAIFILDQNSVIQYVNPVAAHWLDKPDTQLLGHSQAEFFPAARAREHQESIQKVFKTGKVVHTERTNSFKGVEKWIETRLVPLRNPQGTVTHVMGIARDLTEQKRIEESLREQQEWGRKIVSTAMEGFWMIDLEGKVVDVNEAYCRMIGYSRKELLSMRVSDVEVNELPEEVNRHIQRVMDSGNDFFETRHRRKDGQVIDLEVSTTFLKLREPRIFAFFRDITERKRSEQALRASEERFRQLADNIREVFWMTDPAKKQMLYVSPAYEEIWGRTCQGLYNSPRDWTEAIHPEDRDRVLADALTKQVSGQYDEVYRLIRPDGTIRWIQDRAFPVRDDSGNIYRIVGIAEDITRRRDTEEALRLAEAQYRSIFENATEGIFRTTPDGRILAANSALARMFGYQSPEEMMASVTDVGRQLYVSPKQRMAMKDLLQKQGAIQGFEEQIYRKDGSIIWVSLNAHVVRDTNGDVEYFEGTCRDITNRKWVERWLQVQRDFATFLSSSIDLNATAVHLLEIILQNEGIDCGGVFLVDPETAALDLVAHQGFSADFAERASHFDANLGPVHRTHPFRIGPHRLGGPLVGIVRELKRQRLRATEILPIQHGGELVAVLVVGSRMWREIPARSCHALEMVGTQTAGTIARIRAEQSLRASQRLLERTLESLPLAVFVVNADTMVIEECNPAMTRIFGYTRDELIGRSAASLHVNGAAGKEFAMRLRSALESDGYLSGFEFKMRRKNGTIFPTEHNVMSIRNEMGQLVSRVNVVQDITERKRVEEELHQLPRHIIEAQEAERLRVAREMHDGVNQVIASAKMRLGKVENLLGAINPATKEILARCDRLLVRALEENRRIAHNLRPSDLDNLGLVVACRNFCKEFEARTNLTVICHIASRRRRLIPVVELNLFRIVQEALTNVEKHARAKTVRLQLSFRNEAVSLKIQDDGCGFVPQQSRAGRGKRRGIGLTNMRERALSLGGACKVHSAPKKGTTVTVRIPYKNAG